MNDTDSQTAPCRTPWNKGKLIGQKPPLKLREIWTVRTRLQMAGNTREIALFNLAIDSKLRGCDLVRLMVRDVAHGSQVHLAGDRGAAEDQATGAVRGDRPDPGGPHGLARQGEAASGDYLFPSRQRQSPHLSTRQYARIVKGWITLLGEDWARGASIASTPWPRPGSPAPCSPGRSTGCRRRRAGC